MPGCYLLLQLLFAIQKIIQFHSDLRGGWKIEKLGQGAPLSPDRFIEGRHIVNLLHVKWSNFRNSTYIFTKFTKMSCTKFHENRLIIDEEIDE